MSTKNLTKLNYITDLEFKEENITDINDARKKYFITFPYPYMNGRLHLGHLYSISKSEFMSRYKELQGYNVLFPFAFHCTGMPISASAQKLEKEIKNKEIGPTVKILKSLGFNDPTPFIDPIHWLKTFPELNISSLKNFHINVDWRRSFITTDINPYYDSFIKYQFNRLSALGYLSFGKRHTIFCPVDNQPCFDHDRMKGEGIVPVKIKILLIKYKDINLCVRLTDEIFKEVKNKRSSFLVLLKKFTLFKKFYMHKQSFITEEKVYNNLKYQLEIESVEDISAEEIEKIPFKGIKLDIKEIKEDILLKINKKEESIEDKIEELKIEENYKDKILKISKFSSEDTLMNEDFIQFFEPEGEVISRSGGLCCVALTDQWFINYNSREWKNKVLEHINHMILTKETREILVDGVEWIDKWGFSRSFGLGTKVPFDEKYIIESLSDSTIYMAFYTFKHFLFKDLEGEEEIYRKEFLSDRMWKFIFENDETVLENLDDFHKNILKDCRKSLEYFYPVDLRVSGKDLLKNHLLFFLFNHVALFDSKKLPVRIFTNGHLLLNNEKMSKSTGNFMTVDEVINKYGTTATRLTLATCGDHNEDANFDENVAETSILKIYNFIEFIEEFFSKKSLKENISFKEKFFIEGINYNLNQTEIAYEKMLYRDAIKYGFYEMLNLKEDYLSMGGSENNIILKDFIRITLNLLYPIINSISKTLLKKYYNENIKWTGPIENKFNKENNYSIYLGVENIKKQFKTIHKKMIKTKKNKVILGVGKDKFLWKKECDILLKENKNVKENIILYKNIFKKYNIKDNIGMSYIMTKNDLEYDEIYILKELKEYFEEKYKIEIKIIETEEAEKYNPIIKYE